MRWRSWLTSQRTRSESRTIALLQLVAAIAWWLLAFYEGRNTWFVVVAVLWTLVAIRSLLSWRWWRPRPVTSGDLRVSARNTGE